jgi:glycosyltransferase involved in cell wall biosynthesis
MQVIDSLDVGGAERVAVQMANLLPADEVHSFLCTTRRDGPLDHDVASHVHRIRLHRTRRFDFLAIFKFALLLRHNRIQVVHAHGSSIFVARVATFLARTPALVWHDHYGRCELNDRPARLYRLFARRAGVITVNQSLADWARTSLGVPGDRVWYIPNWAPVHAWREIPTLPGIAGKRIVCVANFRAQKDHMTLLRAMVEVKAVAPDVQLLLVGSRAEPHYADYIQDQIQLLHLSDVVSWMGARQDAGAVMRGCDIGVLSSKSEGLPLVLLEYGSCGLAVVATDVGQCKEVLEYGRAGKIVPPESPAQLARAILELLGSSTLRERMGEALRRRVSAEYDAQTILQKIRAIYQWMLGAKHLQPATD